MPATRDESGRRGGVPTPRGKSARGPAAATAQLKQDTDSGATAEKVAAFDPGAAEPGTDTEAAGTPT